MQDLCSTDPTQELVLNVLGRADSTAPTRRRELHRTDQEYICLAWQIYIMQWETIYHLVRCVKY